MLGFNDQKIRSQASPIKRKKRSASAAVRRMGWMGFLPSGTLRERHIRSTKRKENSIFQASLFHRGTDNCKDVSLRDMKRIFVMQRPY